MYISKIMLKSGVAIEPANLNVISGGNGVGKTTLLQELFCKINQYGHKTEHWISKVEYNSENIKEDMRMLKSNLFGKVRDNKTTYYIKGVKKLDGVVDIHDTFSDEEYENIDKCENVSVYNESAKYIKPFVSISRCEERLIMQGAIGLTPINDLAHDSVNLLYRNKKLLKEINKIMFTSFRYYFCILDHTLSNLFIGFSTSEPPQLDRNADSLEKECMTIEEWKDKLFMPYDEAGHGMKSMVNILLAILDPMHQIIIIDEPELFLYATQKRWLGRKLVALAMEYKKQVFIVTHDTIIMQGLLDDSSQTNLLRLERDGSGQNIINNYTFTKSIDINAFKNQNQFLQALFYTKCIAGEGASDRALYQTVFEKLFIKIHNEDMGFVSCGGIGSTIHMASIATKVNLPIAFIYDFDAILFNLPTLKKVYVMRGGCEIVFNKIEALWENIPEIKSAINDNERNKIIKTLSKYSDKIGINGEWAEDNKHIFDELLTDLSTFGIFIVPNGSLESWAPELEEKKRFPEYAPAIILSDDHLKKNIKEFATKVLLYLEVNVADIS